MDGAIVFNSILTGSAIFEQHMTACHRAHLGMSFPLKLAPSHGAIWTPSHGSLGTPVSTSHRASWSVQPFLH